MAYSIIWAENDNRKSFDDFSFIEALDLKALININRGKKIGEPERELQEFFSANKETLTLRQDLFEELLNNRELFDRLDNSFGRLTDIFAFQAQKENAVNNEQLLYSVKEIEAYVEYLKEMRCIFTDYTIKSGALKALWALLEPICTGDDFDALCTAVEKQSHTIRNIKSVTIGINLDSQLMPAEAGVVSINDKSYTAGDYLNRLLRMDFNKSEFVCSAPLMPIGHRLTNEELAVLRTSINSAMNKVLANDLKSWAYIIKKFVGNNLNHLVNITQEWKFVSACANSLFGIKDAGFVLCKPKFDEFDCVNGLYHPILAISASSKKQVIKNDVNFDTKNCIYILTGPNQGGKSIYTQSVGIMFAMLHLGLLLAADSATVKTVDNIFVHFIDIRNRSYVHGRLADECNKIQEINRNITENSLFLFDEALSSTNADEAVAISTEIIAAYSEIKVRGIFTTHFHELCRLPDEYANIKNLTAQIDESSHQRIFKIVCGSGGRSYASDIAEAYGLSKDIILKHAKRSK